MDDISLRRHTSAMQAEHERKVGEVATMDMLVLDESITVAEAAKAMKQKDFSSVFVSSKSTKALVGIVTERDILYRVVAANKGPFKLTLKDIMSAPLITIDESATLREAVILMRKEGIRRLPVRRKGEVVGLVTLQSVVGNMPSKGIEIAQIGPRADVIRCPYCGSEFENKQSLSNHIDRLHIGSGLLEGDLRQL
jgi:signal-transduction protein with cAMP-binding, CBS, and nucleotidyltransferase domain